jgi:hypothetical protein
MGKIGQPGLELGDLATISAEVLYFDPAGTSFILDPK